MILQGLLTETALLTILAIKRGFLCNFAKNFKGIVALIFSYYQF